MIEAIPVPVFSLLKMALFGSLYHCISVPLWTPMCVFQDH